MKPDARRQLILAHVARQGEARVEDLARRFDVSLETMRRDLAQLAEAGEVIKRHGRVRRAALVHEPDMTDRMATQGAQKARAATHLAALIQPNETVFMDTGSTTLACARALARVAGLTCITNSLAIAEVLGRAGRRVFLLGGSYGPANAQTVGPMVIEQATRFRADRAIVTVAGLEARAGATDADVEEAQVARAMLAQADMSVVVADSAKFGRRAAFTVSPLRALGLIVSEHGAQTPDDWLATAPPEPAT
ncbi:DeoR family transcriptional regulator [Rhodobaculum claviforme]|uniref:DeoR family transcriptional regulator n=1 Tax=Rhodobaculum claviforme TaxID=1549854 RepID=UPI001911F31A